MVQKARGGSRTRGRPPKFDRDAVVAAAIGAFWDNGLEATTLPDLEAATGVDRSTLYNSFGGKKGLYELATERYLEQAEAWLFAPLLTGSDDGFADMVDFLTRLRTGLTSPDAKPGCLIVNDMAVGPDKRPSQRYQQLLEDGLRAALGRAGEANATTIEQRMALVVSSVIGINLMSRAGRSADDIRGLVDALIAQVEAWQTDRA